MDYDWNTILKAVALVRQGAVDRLDGQGWKVYRAGPIIRIDLSE